MKREERIRKGREGREMFFGAFGAFSGQKIFWTRKLPVGDDRVSRRAATMEKKKNLMRIGGWL